MSDGAGATASTLTRMVKFDTIHPAVRKTGSAAGRLVRLECLAKRPQPPPAFLSPTTSSTHRVGCVCQGVFPQNKKLMLLGFVTDSLPLWKPNLFGPKH